MKTTFLILLIASLPMAGLCSKVEMPEWEEPKAAASYILGGGLWPNDILADTDTGEGEGESEGETSEEASEGALATTEEGNELEKNPVAKKENLEFFGPAEGTEALAVPPPTEVARTEATETSADAVAEEPVVEALPPLTGELKDLYFAHAPVDFLVDPQRLLTEQKSNDIKRFLEFHSDESDYHIYVFVVGETQKIPDDINLQQLHREWFADSPTVVMFYYREAPDMTEFVYNDAISSALPSSVFERIRQNCLREGAATDLAPDQVEKMAIELSIQLYWLSRLEQHESKEAQALAAETPIHELPASADAPELLREYAPGIFLEESGRRFVSMILTALLIVLVVIIVAAIGWTAIWWRNRDRYSGKPLLFPTFQVVPRLGGEFSGGGFVSMSFELHDPTR